MYVFYKNVYMFFFMKMYIKVHIYLIVLCLISVSISMLNIGCDLVYRESAIRYISVGHIVVNISIYKRTLVNDGTARNSNMNSNIMKLI